MGTSATSATPRSILSRLIINLCASDNGMCLRAKATAAAGVFGVASVRVNENVAGEPLETRSIALTCTLVPSRSIKDDFITLECSRTCPRLGLEFSGPWSDLFGSYRSSTADFSTLRHLEPIADSEICTHVQTGFYCRRPVKASLIHDRHNEVCSPRYTENW